MRRHGADLAVRIDKLDGAVAEASGQQTGVGENGAQNAGGEFGLTPGGVESDCLSQPFVIRMLGGIGHHDADWSSFGQPVIAALPRRSAQV